MFANQNFEYIIVGQELQEYKSVEARMCHEEMRTRVKWLILQLWFYIIIKIQKFMLLIREVNYIT